MKISFYYVDEDYINYLKEVEINSRGSMRFNFMIPIPKQCLIPVDFKDSMFTEQEKHELL